MAIKPLNPHYSMENPATIYDEEALTTLQLVGRTAAKLNETIVAFNTLEQETNEHLEDQDKEIADEFAEQNAAIEEMNTVTMPAKVKEEMKARIEDGTFEDEIDKYAGNLSARLNNLLGSVESGATTMDAEIIDARTDHTGTTWATLGEHMRPYVKLLMERVNGCGEYLTEEIADVTRKTGFYSVYGFTGSNEPDCTFEFAELDGYSTLEFAVNAGDVYLIRCGYGWNQPDAFALDSAGNLLKVYHMAGSHKSIEYDVPIIIPAGAAKLCVSSTTIFEADAKRVVGFNVNSEKIAEMVWDLTKHTRYGSEVLSDAITGTYEAPHILLADGRSTYVESEYNPPKYIVGTFAVTQGEIIHVKAGAGHYNLYYVFYDDNENIIETSEAAETNHVINRTLTVPLKATKIRVAREDATNPSIYRVLGYNANTTDGVRKWSHLKWCCMGDSLTEINIRTDKHYHDYIKEKTGIEVVNMGLSGSGYMKRNGENLAFYQRILNVPVDCDVVTIFGSGNDLTHISALGAATDATTDTICGCINQTISNLRALNPTVQIGIVSPTPWTNNTPNDPSCAMYRYTEKLREICELQGVPFLDLFRLSNYQPNDATYRSLVFSKDPEGTANHPNELGHKIISAHFYTFLESLIGTY